MEIFDMIIDRIKLFEKMFDSMRIVDPVKKEILRLKEGTLCRSNLECYNFWKNQEICENCISIRASNEDKTFFKMECTVDKVYLLTAIPLIIQGEKLVVELFKDASDSLYMQNSELGAEVKMLSAIEHMNRVQARDELTGLYNRRFIHERIPADLVRASLKNEPVSIIFTDLDYFKKINDTYGHTAGDQVLQQFAAELISHIRSGEDWAARYGGEEFLILLTNTDINAARAVAERIRKSVAEKEFIIGDIRIHITASFGVHTFFHEEKFLTVERIIEIVDKKLYQAKAEGRNRVV